MGNEGRKELTLSIIIPVYNVQEYLLECLESVEKSIKKINAEVLLIDDESTDESGIMASSFADDHTGFFYYKKKNGGVSDARNYGAARACGKYICFVDSDDVVEENIYDNMLAAAEYHHADLVLVNAARLDSAGVTESLLFKRMFRDIDDAVTHINECDSLIYDTVVWNKLIRRDFWVRNGFSFPVGWRFEDMPVSFKMHIRANKVAVVHEIGYLWRIRDGVTRSYTQGNNNIANLAHRLKMLEDMYDYINDVQHDHKRLRDLLSFKIMLVDLPIYIDMLANQNVGEEQVAYRELILDFISEYTLEKYLGGLPAAHQLKYRLLIENKKEELRGLVAFEQRKYKNLPFFRDGEETYIGLPEEMFGVDRVPAGNDIRERMPETGITDIELSGTKLCISAYCFVRRVSVPAFEDMDISCVLFNSLTGNKKELEMTRALNCELTKRIGEVYDGNGKQVYKYNYDGTGFRLTIDLEDAGLLDGFSRQNCILVRYNIGAKEGIYTLKSPTHDWDKVFDNTVLVNENNTVRFRLDAAKTLWMSVEKSERGKTQILSGEGTPLAPESQDVLLCGITREGRSSAIIKLRSPFACEEKCRGRIVCHDAFTQTIVGFSEEITLVKDKAEIELSIDIGDHEISKNLYEDRRVLELQIISETAVQYFGLAAEGLVCISLMNDDRRAVFTTDDAGLLVMDVFRINDPTGNRVRYAREMLYPEYRKEPIDEKCIVFEAYSGEQYSCNPRALYEYIDREHPEYKCVWSLADEKTPIKGKGIRVQRLSADYYHYLATAKYFVINENLESAYKKREGQIEIQTMHGTPFKSIGLDVKEDFPDEKSVEKYIKKSRRWNYLVVQGKFSESMAWRWFRYKGNILQTGYPRTDDLFNTTEEEVLTLKKLYKIPLDKKVIIYAPAYRHKGKYEMPLDLDLMRRELSDEYVLLIHLHHFVNDSYKVSEDGSFIIDAGRYSSKDDFYKIADILITDYSSVMFDYTLTGKRIIFFAYDLKEYTSSIRGTCFDLEKEAPGPVARTTSEIINLIRSDNYIDDEKRRAFIEKYLTYENAESSKTIFEEVFIKGSTDKKVRTRSILIKATKKLLPKKTFRYFRKKSMK